AETTGDAFTFVSPDEEADVAAIERAIGRRLPRVTLPGFDYTRRPTEKLEVPVAERLAAHRAQRAVARARAEGRPVRAATAPHPALRAPARPAARARPAEPEASPKAAPKRPGLGRLHRGGRH
ncbi:MAG TPA: ATP-dependent helicase, partial [Gemmatimonadales bacterium]|nr:ATP-dependent helicase [Gemmatimonadales bacterium]